MSTTVEISRPLCQFTTRAQPAIVQFQRRSPRDGQWKHEAFHPTQAELAAAASPELRAIVAQHPELDGYWSCAEVEALVLAFLREEYGITNAVIVDPTAPVEPAQSGEPTVAETGA